MKKILLAVLTACLILSLLPITALAEAAPSAPVVYVTIVKDVQEGTDYTKLATSQLAVTLSDADADGVLTVNDALCLAHEQAYDGDDAGYAYGTDGGLTILRLWGSDRGTYGCYLNHENVSVSAPVSDGDYLTAFVEVPGKQDVYAYFDSDVIEATVGVPVTLTLKMNLAMGGTVTPITLSNATIMLDDVASEFVTDADGKVEIVFLREGVHVVSAVSGQQPIIVPICTATVAAGKGNADEQGGQQNAGTSGGSSDITLPELKFEDDASDKGCKNGCGGVLSAPVGVLAIVGAVCMMVRKKED